MSESACQRHPVSSAGFPLKRQFIVLRRAGCLLVVYFLALAPSWAVTIFGKPSLWMFATGIAAFFAAGLTITLWVLPRMQRKFDDENRRYATGDPREYVVLLRSFESQVLKRESREPEPGNLMKEISDAVPNKLTVVCIGAGEMVRGLLAPATYVGLEPSDRDWYEVFVLMAVGASALIVTPDATPGCLKELRTIGNVPALLAKTLVWMPYAHHAGVESAWNLTRSRLSSWFSLPEYDVGGVLYRPNPDFSPGASWHPRKGELRETLGQVLGEMPRARCSLRIALGELDRQGLKW